MPISRRSRAASHRDFRVAANDNGEARIGTGHRALYSAAPPAGWLAGWLASWLARRSGIVKV